MLKRLLKTQSKIKECLDPLLQNKVIDENEVRMCEHSGISYKTGVPTKFNTATTPI